MKVFTVFLFLVGLALAQDCTITITSGPLAPRNFCAGDLIFNEEFRTLDTFRWRHENTFSGGGNWEFQWYVNDRSNTFIRNGVLHIKPTLVSDLFGADFILWGGITIPPNDCTDGQWFGCARFGNGGGNIVNPIRSGRLSTITSFAFRYGTVEIRAKMPAGDWIWPALWMMPRFNAYGNWPRSGEIDIAESRGNRQLFNGTENVGVEQTGFTMHFGPSFEDNGFLTAHKTVNRVPGFDAGFHLYKITWTDTKIDYFIDDVLQHTVEAGAGFWARGNFAGENIWAGRPPMAPFDQEFYIILNNAVGGIAYFLDTFENRPHPKPWLNTSGRAARDFWDARDQWHPTWNTRTVDSHLQVDYVKVWAV